MREGSLERGTSPGRRAEVNEFLLVLSQWSFTFLGSRGVSMVRSSRLFLTAAI